MSATLGSLLKELAPEWEIKVFEKLASAGEESSNGGARKTRKRFTINAKTTKIPTTFLVKHLYLPN